MFLVVYTRTSFRNIHFLIIFFAQGQCYEVVATVKPIFCITGMSREPLVHLPNGPPFQWSIVLWLSALAVAMVIRLVVVFAVVAVAVAVVIVVFVAPSTTVCRLLHG